MGRHVEEFLAAYRRGQYIGDGVIAAMAEEAIQADRAERDAAGRRQRVAASSAVQAAQALSDDDLYAALFPSPAQAERQRAQLAAAAEARMRQPLSDAEADALFAAGQMGDSQDDDGQGVSLRQRTHPAYSGLHEHEHTTGDGTGRYHTHPHAHQQEADHSHHEQGRPAP